MKQKIGDNTLTLLEKEDKCKCGSRTFDIVHGLTVVDTQDIEHEVVVCLECGTMYVTQ